MSLITLIASFLLQVNEVPTTWVLHERIAGDSTVEELVVEDVDHDRWFVLIREGNEITHYIEFQHQVEDCVVGDTVGHA